MTFLDIKEQIKSAEDAEEVISNLNDPEWREANWIGDWEVELFKEIMKEEVKKAYKDFEEYMNKVSYKRQEISMKLAWLKDEQARIQSLVESKEKELKRMDNFINFLMQSFQKDKLETNLYKISYRKSESVEIINEEMIPQEFMKEKTTVAPDKTAIKEALKNWAEVPGATIKINSNLQIK